jgi:FkbM family methyltransferase
MSLRKQSLKFLASFFKRYHLAFHGGYSVGKAYNGRFLLDWRHPIDKKLAFENFEPERIQFLRLAVERIGAEVFLDIGAHAALYSIVLKLRRPELEVHSFEPDRTNLCQLRANLFLNQLESRIEVHAHGVSNRNGTVSFDTSDQNERRAMRRISDKGGESIEVRRLDDVLALHDRVVAAKIDVEGHECEVIEGAAGFLSRNRCYLQIESGEGNITRLTALLEKLGYRRVACLGDHYFTNISSEFPA